MNRQAFISYASEDRQMAAQICAFLEGREISCWIAPRDITPGANYGEEIVKGIESAEVMVLVLSSHSNRSHNVWDEVERAASKGKAILPVRIEDVQPSKQLELFVSPRHWVDAYPPPVELRLQRLALGIRALIQTAAPFGSRTRERQPAGPPRNSAFPPPHRIAEPTVSFPCRGIITGNRVVVRRGPTVVARMLRGLNQGDEVEVLAEQVVRGSLECQLKDDLMFEPEGCAPYLLRAGRGLVISGESGTHYRVEIRLEGRTDFGYVPKDAVALMDPARWYKVKCGDAEGWVFGRYVRVFSG